MGGLRPTGSPMAKWETGHPRSTPSPAPPRRRGHRHPSPIPAKLEAGRRLQLPPRSRPGPRAPSPPPRPGLTAKRRPLLRARPRLRPAPLAGNVTAGRQAAWPERLRGLGGCEDPARAAGSDPTAESRGVCAAGRGGRSHVGRFGSWRRNSQPRLRRLTLAFQVGCRFLTTHSRPLRTNHRFASLQARRDLQTASPIVTPSPLIPSLASPLPRSRSLAARRPALRLPVQLHPSPSPLQLGFAHLYATRLLVLHTSFLLPKILSPCDLLFQIFSRRNLF